MDQSKDWMFDGVKVVVGDAKALTWIVGVYKVISEQMGKIYGEGGTYGFWNN
jgi:hypothetical protein